MDPVAGFLVSVVALLALTSGALAAVHKPLTAILQELCGAGHRARFWARLYESSLLLLVFFFCLWAPPNPKEEAFAFFNVVVLLRGGIFGLLSGLGVLALLMMVFITRYDRAQVGTRPRKVGPDMAEPTG